MKAAVLSANRVLFSVVGLLSVLSCPLEGFLGPQTIILPRSQSVNAARDLVGWQREIHRPGNGCNYWVFAFTPEYTHTFQSDHLTRQLFGRDHFEVTGSAVKFRKPSDLLADYFGLPRDYQSELCVYPRISQFIVDFNFFVALDRIRDGLFFLIHFPVVHTKWDIRLRENVTTPGVAFDPAGYFSADRIARKDLMVDMREYLLGKRTVGDMAEPLLYQRVFGLSGRSEDDRLSDVQGALGYDFARSEAYHVGIEARASAPAGNRPNADFLFDAVVGNGHHWELGCGLTSHYRIWEDDRHAVLVYLDANITHLFSAASTRSFNLCGRCPGSRYMMAEQISVGSRDLFAAGEPTTDQYTRRLMPLINATTFCVETSFAVQADIALKFAWYRDNFCLDVGYNFWGRSKEKLDCRPLLMDNCFALKGDAQIYGFGGMNEAIPLSVSQDQATIFAGQGVGNFVSGVEFANDNADNKMLAFGPGVADVLTQLNGADSVALGIAQQQVATSQPSIFLSDNDLDNNSVLVPTSLTSKVFVHAGQTWYSARCNPFIGLGSEVEWVHGDCDSGGIAQWGIWFKLGLSY